MENKYTYAIGKTNVFDKIFGKRKKYIFQSHICVQIDWKLHITQTIYNIITNITLSSKIFSLKL